MRKRIHRVYVCNAFAVRLLPKTGLLVDGTAVLVGMLFGRFAGVMCRVKPVPVSDMRVVRRLLGIAGFLVLGSFEMMSRCQFVAFCRFLVVFSAFVGCHVVSRSCSQRIGWICERPARNISVLTNSRIEVYSRFVTPS
jgi:hypothetical protein